MVLPSENQAVKRDSTFVERATLLACWSRTNRPTQVSTAAAIITPDRWGRAASAHLIGTGFPVPTLFLPFGPNTID